MAGLRLGLAVAAVVAVAQTSAFTSPNALTLRGPRAAAGGASISRTTMQWSDEERAAKAKAQAERNARLLREREERQRRLVERDQQILEAKKQGTPQNMEKKGDFVMDEGNWGDNAQGLFGWANNNPSSKSAIYDTEFINSAAGGGNVGEMMIEMRGKGKTEEGREVEISGKGGKSVRIYYRTMGEASEGSVPLLMVHGVLDHSWSWREMMKLAAQDGVQSFALDMPGCGYSSWPQPGYDYEWSEQGVKETLERFLEAVGVEGPVNLMVQGFVYGQVSPV